MTCVCENDNPQCPILFFGLLLIGPCMDIFHRGGLPRPMDLLLVRGDVPLEPRFHKYCGPMDRPNHGRCMCGAQPVLVIGIQPPYRIVGGFRPQYERCGVLFCLQICGTPDYVPPFLSYMCHGFQCGLGDSGGRSWK